MTVTSCTHDPGRGSRAAVPWLLAASLWTFVPAAAVGGTPEACVRGRVVDAETGAPIAGARVAVDAPPLDARTGDDGRFEICGVADGPRRLDVSVVGYIFVRRTLPAGGDPVTLPLAPGTGTYTETVRVEAQAVEPASRGVPSRRVLGSAELQDLRGVLADDPFRAVQALPGVAATDDFRSEFSVRGLGYRDVGVVLDGVETPALLHAVGGGHERSGSVATINTDILERVTLAAGGYPQRFGGRLGAQVEFETREGSRLRRQARAAVSGTNASVVAEGPLAAGRGSWLVSARKSYLDLIIDRIADDHDFAFGFSDVHAKVGWDLTPRQHLVANVVAGWSRLDRERAGLGTNSLSRGATDSSLASLRWSWTPSASLVVNQWVSVVTAGFRNVNREAYLLDRGHRSDAGWRGTATLSAGPHWLVEAGADARRMAENRLAQRIRLSTSAPIVEDDWAAGRWRAGAYLQGRLALAREAAINVGTRVDRWGTIAATDVSPWMQAELPLSRSIGLRGGTGVYRQPADFDQVQGTRGGTQLSAARAWQADLGLAARLTPSLTCEAVAYGRRERDVLRLPGSEMRWLDGEIVPESSSTRWENALSGDARGIEVMVERRAPNGVSGWLSYAWARARYDDEARGESFWSDFDQRHTVNAYVHSRFGDRTSVAVKLRTGSNYPITGYIEQAGGDYVLSRVRNVTRLPLYARLDVRANRTFRAREARVTVFVEIINAWGRENRRVAEPYLASGDGRLGRVTETLIPFVPSGGLLVEF